MIIFQAIIYGIVQGITEFLPVSSTAHLNLIPWIFGWESLGNVFDVAPAFWNGNCSDCVFLQGLDTAYFCGFYKAKNNRWEIVLVDCYCNHTRRIGGGIAGQIHR